MSYVYHVERRTVHGNMKVCEIDVSSIDDKAQLCYALAKQHARLTAVFGCNDIELGGDARTGWYLYQMSMPSISIGYVKFDAVRYTPTSDPFADFPNIRQPLKKVLTDLCPKCNIAGKFGARATLLCPKCNYVIGGLG